MLEDARLIQKTPGMYAVFGGDGVDNFIKHQSAMVAKTSNPEEEYAALYWFLSQMRGSLLAGVSGNHDCLSDDTELLTRRGWVSYLDIRDSDQVFSMNPET